MDSSVQAMYAVHVMRVLIVKLAPDWELFAQVAMEIQYFKDRNARIHVTKAMFKTRIMYVSSVLVAVQIVYHQLITVFNVFQTFFYTMVVVLALAQLMLQFPIIALRFVKTVMLLVLHVQVQLLHVSHARVDC